MIVNTAKVQASRMTGVRKGGDPADVPGRAGQRRAAQAARRGRGRSRSAAKSRGSATSSSRTGRSGARRVLPDDPGARLRRSRAASTTPARCSISAFGPEHGQEAAGPAHQGARRRKPRPSTRCRRPIRSSWRKFIHSEHPQTIALVLSHLNPVAGGRHCCSRCRRKCAPTSRCAWPAWTRFRPRSSPRSPAIIGQKLKSSGRVQPRVLRRRARGGGDVQPPRFEHQQGDPGQHRAAGPQPGRRPSAT